MRIIDADALHGEISKWPGSVMYKDWVQSAVANAPTIDLPPNTPLTVEELRGMNGNPVWLKRENPQYYDILGGITKSGKVCFYTAELSLENYGKTWLAYHRKPERESNNG